MSSGGSGGMLKTILTTILILVILALVIFWLVTGGIQRAWGVGKSFTNPIALIFGNGTSTGASITLPWQPASTRGPDISDYVGQADAQQSAADAGSSEPDATVTNLQQYGNPSPYAGQVTIAGDNATAASPAQEYVQIQASSGNTAPINVTGWVLQSAVSRLFASVPLAAPVFIGGAANSVRPVLLAPGATAILTTGLSPIGVSFQESECTGYLSQLQQFYPNLGESCPAPSDALPQTAENLRTYGASCFDYIASMQSCFFAGNTLPASLTPACRSFIANNLSYNGCVATYQAQPDFAQPSWRLYLGQSREFWNNAHDIIRLLDTQGRIVDVLTY